MGGFYVVVVGVIAHVAKVVFSAGMTMRAVRRGGGGEFGFGEVVVGVGVLMKIIGRERVEAHGHEFGEEEREDGHKGNAFDPGVLSDGAGEAWVSKSLICRSKELWCD